METIKKGTPMKYFFAKLTQLPFVVYAASILSAVVWCMVLSMIDNEAPETVTFFEKYLPAMSLLYGIPIAACIVCFTIAIQQRGYRSVQTLKWSIPLGCLCGTVFTLLVIGTFYGWMKLTGTA
jgi:hypothetical protein